MKWFIVLASCILYMELFLCFPEVDMVLKNRKLLYISSDKLDWPNAVDACFSRGLQLVSVTSRPEQLAVAELSKKVSGSVWIGGYNYQSDKMWRWIGNGKLIIYNNWNSRTFSPNQPDNYKNKQNCIRIDHTYFRKWDDIECTYVYHYICEYVEKK